MALREEGTHVVGLVGLHIDEVKVGSGAGFGDLDLAEDLRAGQHGEGEEADAESERDNEKQGLVLRTEEVGQALAGEVAGRGFGAAAGGDDEKLSGEKEEQENAGQSERESEAALQTGAAEDREQGEQGEKKKSDRQGAQDEAESAETAGVVAEDGEWRDVAHLQEGQKGEAEAGEKADRGGAQDDAGRRKQREGDRQVFAEPGDDAGMESDAEEGAGDGGEDALGAGALMVVDVMRAFRADDRHRARLFRKTALYAQRLPRAVGFVLGDKIAEFRGRTESRHVAQGRNCAADVDQRQPDRAADGRVAARARPERVMAGVDAQLRHHRPVDDDQRRA